MPDNGNQTRSWALGLAVVGIACAVLVSGAYFARLAGDVQTVGVDVRNEVAELRAALAKSSAGRETESAAGLECLCSTESSASLVWLRDEIGVLADTMVQVQLALQEVSAGQGRRGGNAALAPDFEPFPMPSPPKLGANPEKMMQWRDETSAEMREYVNAVMRDHSERARQKIQAQSTDPMRPDFQVVSRVMQESHDEIAAELRQILPREDFEALFPPQAGAWIAHQ